MASISAVRPLVSVLVPVYNAERWLEATVGCVLEQSWRNVEVILVDDGSRDGSLAVARSLAGPRVKVIAQPNSGANVARQRALEESQGELLQYLDADDLLSRDKIERQVERLAESEPGCIASCAWSRFWGPGTPRPTGKPEPVWRDLDPVTWVVTSAMGGGMMPVHAWLTPRDVAERAGPWASFRAPNDDGEYFNRTVLASRGVRFVADAWAYYRSGIGGWSGAQSPAAIAGTFRGIESMAATLLEREDSARTRAAAAALFQRFAHDVYPDAPELVAEAEARVAALGGSALRADGGPTFELVSRLVGWKGARRIQRAARRYRARARRLLGSAAESTGARPSTVA